MRGQARSAGFTLMEILLVLVVMSLVLALTPPLFSNAMPSLSLKAFVNDLSSDLRYVRDSAVMQSRDTAMSIDFKNRLYGSTMVSRVGAKQIPDNVEITVVGLGEESFSEGELLIRFFSDGSSNGGKILVGNEANRYVIDIDWLTGRIQVREPTQDERRS